MRRALILLVLITVVAYGQLPKNPVTPAGVGGASALTGTKKLLLDASAGEAGLSSLTESGNAIASSKRIDLGAHRIIGVSNPTATQDAATKSYVDAVVGVTAVYLFNDTASDLAGIYYTASLTDTEEAESALTTAGLTGGNGQALYNFATATGGAGLTKLKAGIYSVHFHAAKTAGNFTVAIYAEVYTRAGATETLRVTTGTSGAVTTKGQFTLTGILASDVTINATDRIIIKLLANLSGGAAPTTVVLYQEGLNDSYLALPSNAEVLAGTFVSGAPALTTPGAVMCVDAAGKAKECGGLLDDGTQVYDVSARKFGLGTTALLPPIGKFQTVISTTNPFIVGGATVASYTAVTSPTTNKDYLVKTGAGTAATVGDLVVITAGTGAYTGMYTVLSKPGADTIQLNRVCHASGTDIADIAFSQSTAPKLAVGTNRTFHSALLSNATGNEVAFRYDYTTDKAAGNDTGLQINMTDTLSPGTSAPVQVNVGGTEKLRVNHEGGLYGFGYVNWYIDAYGTASVSALYVTNLARFGGPGTSIGRTSKGILQINSDTLNKWGGLQAGSIAMQSLATPTITSVTPSANNGISCSYKLVAYLADGVTATAASAAVATALGPTNCNTMTVVWTAASAASFYQLERTGGATSGIITAMGGATATWANSTTNCPAGICTYVDTGSAASGAAPTVNSTGSILPATDSIGLLGGPSQRWASLAVAGAGTFGGNVTGSTIIAAAVGSYQLSGRSRIYSSGNGLFDLYNDGLTGFTRLNFGGATNSFSGLATGVINGFAIQSAAGTSIFNDALTAASGTVAQRRIFHIDGPVLTATNTSVTYTNTATMHLGVPTASTNVTFTNPALSLLLDGGIKAASYLSSDGTVGATGTCSGAPVVKNGLVVSCAGI